MRVHAVPAVFGDGVYGAGALVRSPLEYLRLELLVLIGCHAPITKVYSIVWYTSSLTSPSPTPLAPIVPQAACCTESARPW